MRGDSDVAIFWDYENCHAAAHISGYEIVKKIRYIAHDFGSIKLFKAYLELSEPAAYSRSLYLRSELQSSGVSLIDTPHNGRKDVADKMMLVDMLAHAIDNPPPATIILISGDRDFAYAVSILRSRRYRVVIISLGGVHMSLRAHASVFLDWNADVLGMECVEQGLYSSIGQNELCSISASSRSQIASQNTTSAHIRPQNQHNSEESNVGIPHLSSNSLNAQNAGYDIEKNSTFGEINSKNEASSYHVLSNTEDSIYTGGSGTLTFRAPSRTESAPANITFSPSTFPHNALLKTGRPPMSNLTLSSKPSTSVNVNLVPKVVNIQEGVRNEEPGPLRQVSQPVVPIASTPLPTHRLSTVIQPTRPQATPIASTAPVPPTVVSSALIDIPLTSVRSSDPKVVPAIFGLLVQRLEFHRSKGVLRPFRSGVAVELATQDNMLYRRAGTEKFGQYVALAEKAGIIVLGGKEGGAWIALHPDWYGARLDSY
ncbi:NYN domain-containing protein [Collybia nuda]|uniref:NYN domain-containing protein n=1 Tax=Collybia nuda TaxID=64659 RepID=A0A9P5YEJ6_9AGAR|nr:NYN domain-containing protein [Collybia nuda]